VPEYRTPGVYIEEVSGGPRPVQPSSTTNTGFVGVLTLPASFVAGAGEASGMYLPAQEEDLLLGWNRALAFRSLAAPAAAAPAPSKDGKKDAKAAPAAPASDSRLGSLISDVLPGAWTVQPPNGENTVSLVSGSGDVVRFPISRTLMSVKEAAGQAPSWELAWGADESKVLQTLGAYAKQYAVKHSGNLGCVDTKAKPLSLDVASIHDRLTGPAPSITAMSGYHAWRREFGEDLFKEIALSNGIGGNEMKAQALWDGLSGKARGSWDNWLRSHPGLHRLELALQGFFENGGATAYIAMIVQAHGAAGPNKRGHMEVSFDSQPSVAMVAAPGLEQSWQQALLEYAGQKGRADLFAIMETPRYLLTREPRSTKLGPFRWVQGDSPYEVSVLDTQDTPQSVEQRFLGYANDELLDRVVPRDDAGYGGAYGPWLIVDNPLSTGPHDRFVVAPPSGHVAGVIASTDLRAGGGVHKAPANEQVLGVAELATSVSDREQGALNMKSINIIRHRPGAGIRVWGARTTAADANWRYVNVRRLFLFVERSVRDAVNWAVFMPNTEVTRRDLATTIKSFLYSLWNQGMLDGASHSDAYKVQCDAENNPDVDVRSGILTVDVEFRPPYPAEFVRIRFRQTPMEVPE